MGISLQFVQPDVHSGWRAIVERILPWYRPTAQRQRDRVSVRVARRSEEARARAARVIDQYRRAEYIADQSGKHVAEAVADLRSDQKDATEAGERVIDEIEKQ